MNANNSASIKMAHRLLLLYSAMHLVVSYCPGLVFLVVMKDKTGGGGGGNQVWTPAWKETELIKLESSSEEIKSVGLGGVSYKA